MTGVKNFRSAEKYGGFEEWIPKNKKINWISVAIGVKVKLQAGRSQQRTGVVSAISILKSTVEPVCIYVVHCALYDI